MAAYRIGDACRGGERSGGCCSRSILTEVLMLGYGMYLATVD